MQNAVLKISYNMHYFHVLCQAFHHFKETVTHPHVQNRRLLKFLQTQKPPTLQITVAVEISLMRVVFYSDA